MALIPTYTYVADGQLDPGQVVIVCTVQQCTVLHHPDADDAEIEAGIRDLFAAAARRHGAERMAEALRDAA